MTTLRGIAQPSNYLLTHRLLAYWRKLLVSLELERQTFKEGFRDGIEQFLKFRLPVGHPFAVGCDHVFSVGEHPVDTAAAHDYVLARRPVGSEEQIGAISAGDIVGPSFAARVAYHEVVSFLAHYVVGAFAADNCIVTRAAHQVLVAS